MHKWNFITLYHRLYLRRQQGKLFLPDTEQSSLLFSMPHSCTNLTSTGSFYFSVHTWQQQSLISKGIHPFRRHGAPHALVGMTSVFCARECSVALLQISLAYSLLAHLPTFPTFSKLKLRQFWAHAQQWLYPFTLASSEGCRSVWMDTLVLHSIFSLADLFQATFTCRHMFAAVLYAVNLLCSRHIGADGAGGSNAESTIGLLTMAGKWSGVSAHAPMHALNIYLSL